MALPDHWDTGTASVTNGETTVTFSAALLGTERDPNIMAGDLFCDPAQPSIPPQRIASVDYENETATLWAGWPGTTMSADAYEVRYVGDIVRSTAQTRRLLEQLSVVEANGRGLFFRFDDGITDADPGSGNLRLNHATIGSATAAYIDNLDANGATVSSVLDTWDDAGEAANHGQLWVRSIAAPSTFAAYTVTNSVVDGTGYRKLTLSYIGGSGSLAADDEIMVMFLPRGADGADAILGDWKGAWVTATPYLVNDLVEVDGSTYICIEAHTSDDFATDLAADKWDLSLAAGVDGSDPGILLTWDVANDDSDPGPGRIKADDDDLSAATTLYIDKANRGNSDIEAFLLGLDDATGAAKGTLTLTDPATEDQVGWNVTGVTDATGYVKVAISGHFGETAIADTTPVSLQFSRAGDTGPKGDKGDQGDKGAQWEGAWVTATAYAVDDVVKLGGSAYICLEAHTSDDFSTDLAADKWELMVEKGDSGSAGAAGGGLPGIRLHVIDTAGGDPDTDYEAGQALDGETLVSAWVIGRFTPGGHADDGIYIVPVSGAASRHPDFDTWDKCAGAMFPVMMGTTNADTLWRCTSDPGGGTIDSDPLVFEEHKGGGGDAIDLWATTSYIAVKASRLHGAPLYFKYGFADGLGSEAGMDTSASAGEIYDAADDSYSNIGDAVAALTFDSNSTGWGGYTLVSLIPASAVTKSGKRVRITFTPPSSGNSTVIAACYVGHPAGSGDAYDFDGAQAQLTVGGSGGFTLTAGGSVVVSDWIEFALDDAKDLLVAYNVTSGDFRKKTTGATNFNSYYRASTAEAATSNKTTGYTVETDVVHAISKIEAADDFSLISNAFDLPENAGEVRIFAELEYSDSLTPDTDFDLSASANNGSAYLGTVTPELWSSVGNLKTYVVDGLDLSGQADDALRVRFRSLTGCPMKFRGWRIGAQTA